MTMNHGKIEGELLDDSLSEGNHQEIDEDDLPLKDRNLTLSEGGIVDSLILELIDANILELPCLTK